MLRRNHQIVALAITTAMVAPLHLSIPSLLLVELTTILTTNIPDIDQKLPLLKHRGITHTIWSWLLITISIYYLTNNKLITIVTAISYLSHLIIDSLAIAGIRWFGPFTNSVNDNQYGICIGHTATGQTIHHHFNFKGYRVGSPLEYIITAEFGICYIITLLITIHI